MVFVSTQEIKSGLEAACQVSKVNLCGFIQALRTHEVVGGINEELSATDKDGWRTEEGWHVLQLPPLLRPNGKYNTLKYISK